MCERKGQALRFATRQMARLEQNKLAGMAMCLLCFGLTPVFCPRRHGRHHQLQLLDTGEDVAGARAEAAGARAEAAINAREEEPSRKM